MAQSRIAPGCSRDIPPADACFGSVCGRVEVSADGLDYAAVGDLRIRGRSGSVTVDDTARYVAVTVEGGRHGTAVRRLSVTAG